MLSQIVKFLKKIIISFFMLYGYDILVPSTVVIPINIITITILTIFNLPGLLLLILIKLLIY